MKAWNRASDRRCAWFCRSLGGEFRFATQPSSVARILRLPSKSTSLSAQFSLAKTQDGEVGDQLDHARRKSCLNSYRDPAWPGRRRPRRAWPADAGHSPVELRSSVKASRTTPKSTRRPEIASLPPSAMLEPVPDGKESKCSQDKASYGPRRRGALNGRAVDETEDRPDM